MVPRISEALLTWYWANKRDLPWRKTSDPYWIWVSEIMLQQTQVSTVIPYYERFIEGFPTAAALARASEDEVLSLWKGLGYYSRARNLWRGAQYVLEQFDGVIPQDHHDLRKIPGVGEYTAGAIASIAFGVKIPAIDGNVNRVVSRVLGWREPVESVQSRKTFIEKLKEWQPEEYPGDFNQALMELGAMICTPRAPQCEACPIAKECEAYSLNDVLSFPVKRQKSGPKVVTRLTFVLRKEGKVYLQQRPDKGLLARLWEFPGVEVGEEERWCGEADWGILRTITPDQWFEFYKKSVHDRSFDRSVRQKMSQSFKLSGPLWYTFSHRRWQIYWALIDLDELNQVDGWLLKENPVEHNAVQDLSEQMAVYEAKKWARWVKLEELDKETIPVAFNEIVESLTEEKGFGENK